MLRPSAFAQALTYPRHDKAREPKLIFRSARWVPTCRRYRPDIVLGRRLALPPPAGTYIAVLDIDLSCTRHRVGDEL